PFPHSPSLFSVPTNDGDRRRQSQTAAAPPSSAPFFLCLLCFDLPSPSLFLCGNDEKERRNEDGEGDGRGSESVVIS
ncbi:unnamed protein product, partial [Linum tenue]